FQDVEKNTEKLKFVIKQRVEQSRKALEEQYRLIFKDTPGDVATVSTQEASRPEAVCRMRRTRSTSRF
ncbi:hypothetical protein ACQ7B2_00870, partial [Escherichia coli]